MATENKPSAGQAPSIGRVQQSFVAAMILLRGGHETGRQEDERALSADRLPLSRELSGQLPSSGWHSLHLLKLWCTFVKRSAQDRTEMQDCVTTSCGACTGRYA